MLALPLARLTFARVDEKPAKPGSEVKKVTEKVPTFIRVRLAHTPNELSLKLDGQELLSPEQQKSRETDLSFTTEIAIPPDGIEIIATATWPEGTPATAITLDLEPDEKGNRSLTNWSTGDKLLPTAFPFNW